MQSKAAFTVIELLMVISIIGILAGLATLDFQSARQRQALDLASKEWVALNQRTRAEVASGHFEEGFECQGIFLEEGERPLAARAPFDAGLGLCTEPFTENFGTAQDNVKLSNLTVGALTQDAIWLFYLPPEGDLQFLTTGQFEGLAGELQFDLVHKNNPERFRSFQLDPQSQRLEQS